jgi:hypothetical protein
MTFIWFLSGGIVMLATLIFSLLRFQIELLMVAYLAVSFCFIAIGLYGLRERFRLLYGLTELLFGLFIMFGSINAISIAERRENIPIIGGGVWHRPPGGVLHISEAWVAWLGVIASVYILVRAMDNIGEGLKLLSNQKWSMIWQRIFSKAKSNMSAPERNDHKMVPHVRLGPTDIKKLEDQIPPHLDEQEKALALGCGVLRAFLGAEWVERHIISDGRKKGFLSVDDSDDAKLAESCFRLIDLAETLYNLQNVPGFDECLYRMRQAAEIEGPLAEFDFARMLFFNKVPFRFVETTGVKKQDYDFDIIYPNSIAACADSKCKMHTADFTENGLFNVFKKARAQLPNDRPGIIFVKVPERWFDEEEFKRLSIPCAKRYLGGVQRIVSIKFYTTRFVWRDNLMKVEYAFKEISNSTTEFGNNVDWNIFKTPEFLAGSNDVPEHFDRIILKKLRISRPQEKN